MNCFIIDFIIYVSLVFHWNKKSNQWILISYWFIKINFNLIIYLFLAFSWHFFPFHISLHFIFSFEILKQIGWFNAVLSVWRLVDYDHVLCAPHAQMVSLVEINLLLSVCEMSKCHFRLSKIKSSLKLDDTFFTYHRIYYYLLNLLIYWVQRFRILLPSYSIACKCKFYLQQWFASKQAN